MEFELSELDKKMNMIITDYESRIIEFAEETRRLEKARNFELIRLFKNVLLNIELYEAKVEKTQKVPGPPVPPSGQTQVG